MRQLVRPNVEVVQYADQWRALGVADLFITHHGVNSTHEAVFHRVPMLSYPFFTDQPALAARCQQLGIAVPLTETLRGAMTWVDLRTALGRIAKERKALLANLDRARTWEWDVIAQRDLVLRRIQALI